MSTSHATQLAHEANKLYKAGSFSEAKDIYTQLSERLQTKAFKYNIALCEKKIKSLATARHTAIEDGCQPKTDRTAVISCKKSITLKWEVNPSYNYIFSARLVINSKKKDKHCIALLEYYDQANKLVSPNKREAKLPWSTIYNKYFFYIESAAEACEYTQPIPVPSNIYSIVANIKAFSIQEDETIEVSNTCLKLAISTLSIFDHIRTHTQPVEPRSVKVAMVSDEFTYNSFKNEFIPVIISPSDWREQFSNEEPELFFCESAWSGVDSIARPWKGKVYASSSFQRENRCELLDIISHCRKNHIPTIFWNKEDPTHYSDRYTDFVRTAQEFDFIFTTAEECVSRYKHDIRRDNVFVMPFASNPHLFNPITDWERSNDIVFAGSWYRTHSYRCMDTVKMLDALLEAKFNIRIYDRYYGSEDSNRRWPDKYQKYILAGVPISQMPNIYKESVYGLNINTVKESRTMFARRVFELMTSNTLVISNSSAGMDTMLPGLFINVEDGANQLADLSISDLSIVRRRAMSHVLAKHTYANRWIDLLKLIGCRVSEYANRYTLCVIINRLEEAEVVHNWYYRHGNDELNLSLCIVAGKLFPNEDLQDLYSSYNRSNYTVTSYAHIKRYAIKSYNPIATEYFAVAKLSNLATLNQFIESFYHTQYIKDFLVHPTNCNSERYMFNRLSNNTSLLVGSAKLVKDALLAIEDDNYKHEVYHA